MYPIAIARAGAALGPYLTRIATRDPAVTGKLVTLLRKGSSFAGSKVSDIVAFVKTSPVNAMLAFTSLATLGYSIAELFKDDPTPEVKEFANSLDQTAMEAAGLIAKAGAVSETLNVVDESQKAKVDATVAAQVLTWARTHYGSIQRAVEAHAMHQAFFEMSKADVDEAVRLGRLYANLA